MKKIVFEVWTDDYFQAPNGTFFSTFESLFQLLPTHVRVKEVCIEEYVSDEKWPSFHGDKIIGKKYY